MKNNKSGGSILMIAVLVVTAIAFCVCSACAEESTWDCPECGKTGNTNQYCGGCGYARDGLNDDTQDNTAAWPEDPYSETEVKMVPLQDSDGRHQAYFGPDKNTYASAGAYQPQLIYNAKVLFREGDYALVDFSERDSGKRCLYFKYIMLMKPNNAKAVNLKGYPAKTTNLLIPMYGPGEEYASVTQNMPSQYADWSFDELVSEFGGSYEIGSALKPVRNSVYIEAGTQITVFFEMDGWVFAEVKCSLGLIRAWFPAEYVTTAK